MDPGLPEEGTAVQAMTCRTTQGGTDEMAGNGALAHGRIPGLEVADGRALPERATRGRVAEIPLAGGRKPALNRPSRNRTVS
ncbi:hypothetical protein PtoMrB4_16430 [Metapseudomonas otitidis]|uniref:Uncharacterized protein n=1 Tax=Metapseudomonas otitidis TaxID=319939 RepID=A0A679GAP0_9GAMM|nr:hypothetical protein PtoMrB4_16430 [Pseudomonas otitidis]